MGRSFLRTLAGGFRTFKMLIGGGKFLGSRISLRFSGRLGRGMTQIRNFCAVRGCPDIILIVGV
jgi:hypothetical protein